MNSNCLKPIVLCLVFLLKLCWLNFDVAHAGELNGTNFVVLVPAIKGGVEDFNDPWPMTFERVTHNGTKITAWYKFGDMISPVVGEISKMKEGLHFSFITPGSRVVFRGKLIPDAGEEYTNFERQVISVLTANGGKILWKIADGNIVILHNDVNIFSDRPQGAGTYSLIGFVFRSKTVSAK